MKNNNFTYENWVSVKVHQFYEYELYLRKVPTVGLTTSETGDSPALVRGEGSLYGGIRLGEWVVFM